MSKKNEPESAEEVRLKRSIEERMSSINEILEDIGFKANESKKNEVKEEEKETIGRNFNSKGELLMTVKEVKKNHENAFFLWKWYELPYCRELVFQKMKYCTLISPFFTSFLAINHYKENGLTKIPWKYIFKINISITLLLCAASLAESLIFEPYW